MLANSCLPTCAAQAVADGPFARVSYTDAVALLQKAPVKFEFPVRWGTDLQSEHERYLVEMEFGGTPLFVTDYPRDIKVGTRVQGSSEVGWKSRMKLALVSLFAAGWAMGLPSHGSSL